MNDGEALFISSRWNANPLSYRLWSLIRSRLVWNWVGCNCLFNKSMVSEGASDGVHKKESQNDSTTARFSTRIR